MPPAERNMTDVFPIKQLLVVDDEPDTAQMLAQLLRLLLPGRWKVSLAFDGQAAVEHARRDHFDVVVMDIEMPVLDGVGAATAMRAAAGSAPPMLIAASANASKITAATAAGVFDHALLKPVDIAALERLITSK